MDSFRAYYEYPSSQAAIHALPPRNASNGTKSKRSWGNILRITGLSKRDRDTSPSPVNRNSQAAAIYAPGFNLPQGTAYAVPTYSSPTYASPTYGVPQNHFISNTPYRDLGRNYAPDRREKYSGYNATYGRSNSAPVTQVATSPNGSGKNTVRYTDWFGSVVGKKSPVRPSLPLLHNNSGIPGENNSPTVTSWDNYVSIQSPPAAIGIPAIVPISNYSNVCICPDQLFSTRSKKKKKCKQCGRKYGTVKHATAVGSVSKIRPSIPPNFYQSPAAIWAWPQPTKNAYSPQYIMAPQPLQPINFIERERAGDSPPLTPETIRSTRSGKSNESSSTLRQEPIGNYKAIPPPPTVPLPSIPKVADSEMFKDRKKTIIPNTRSSAYELMEKENGLVVSSDTDDLSDNAVHDPWDTLTQSSILENKLVEKAKLDKEQKRISVISIGGEDLSTPSNAVKVVSPPSQHLTAEGNKVRIHTTAAEKIYSPPIHDVNTNSRLSNGTTKQNSNSPSSSKVKPNNVSNRSSFQYDWNDAILLNGQSPEVQSSSLNSFKNDTPKSNYSSSSQVKKQNKYNSALRAKLRDKPNSEVENDLIERDKSKVVSIAGQRILFDHQSNNNKNNNRLSETSSNNRGVVIGRELEAQSEFGEWETFNEDASPEIMDLDERTFSDSNRSQNSNQSMTEEFSGFNGYNSKRCSDEELTSEKMKEKFENLIIPKSNYSFKAADLKWNLRSPDIRDTIHEEEEEYDDEDEDYVQSKNVTNGVQSADHRVNGVSKSERYLEQDEGDKDTSSSSASSPVRGEGFLPTLSELLQVKSILKRPNSLDTSSETDSDFYLPTFSEYKQNARKKKSVQFRQSHEVNLVEDVLETKGRKVSTLRSVRRDRERRKEKPHKVSESNGVPDDRLMSESRPLNDKESVSNKLAEKYTDNWTSIDERTIADGGENCTNVVEETLINLSDVDLDRGMVEKTEIITPPINKTSEGSGSSLRRSHSHKQTFDDNNSPSFNDTYRLRQMNARPSILSFEDTELRRPTRRAPPPPRNSTSPIRPTVPPPPPPPSFPLALHEVAEEAERLTNSSSKYNGRSSPTEGGRSSPSSTSSSLSPPSSPPPPLPSSPPPLPTSSPPPLDDEDVEISSPEITFSSFKDPLSSVSVSSKMLQITPNTRDLSNHQICNALPATRNSSIFDDSEDCPTATIRGRAKAANVPDMSSFQFLSGSTNSVNQLFASSKCERRPKERRTKSPPQRSSFLSSMVEEADHDERFSDHIYEELPSLPSSETARSDDTSSPERSMFDGASKYEILEYLQDARNRVNIADDETDEISNLTNLTEQLENMRLDDEEDVNGLDSPDDPLLTSRYMDGRSSNRSSNSESSENSGLLRSDKERLQVGEIERTDSGVGSETSKPNIIVRRPIRGEASSSTASGGQNGLKEGDLPPCDDCDSPVETRVTNSGLMYAPLVCRRCARRRQERKEILTEIMETEVKYGRDLRVMMEQFNRPMRVAGLLSTNQLDRIFLNVEDLIEHNRQFALQIKDAFEIALDQGDEDLLTVNVAKLFLQAGPMLHAFQNYCVRQGPASILLQNLEKEKELFRIFLKVSQMENTLLRRMNLHSFLMVPVQRVTKYPLLLARLYKSTPPSHSSREDCRRAREKIEIYLQHINNETKETSPTKLWRRFSMSVGNNNGPSKWLPSAPPDYDTSSKLRNLVLEVLEWNTCDAFIVREGRLLCLPPESSNWTRRGRGFKMATVQMVLVTLGTPRTTLEEAIPEDGLVTPHDLGIKEAAILAFKDHRLTKTALIREPWILSRVVVTWDAEGETECFELTDLVTKETFIFKDRECVGTEEWFRSVQFHALSVGSWRRRRSAMANIMINGAKRS